MEKEKEKKPPIYIHKYNKELPKYEEDENNQIKLYSFDLSQYRTQEEK